MTDIDNATGDLPPVTLPSLEGLRHNGPRLRPIAHPLAPRTHPVHPGSAEPLRRLPPASGVTLDPQGEPLPSIDDISGLCADLVQWGPCPNDPWDRWGWSSVVFLIQYYVPPFLGMSETDWRELARSTDYHTAASALIYLECSLGGADYPPPGIPQLLEHIAQAFNMRSQASSPHLRAIDAIRHTIDRKIMESLPEDGPVFLSPLSLPSLPDIRRIWPEGGGPLLRLYDDLDQPDWHFIVCEGEGIARHQLVLPPETWARAERMIGLQLTAIAALTVFAEQGQAPAAPRFLQLVRSEFSRPGYLRDRLRPRLRSTHPRGPLLGQPRPQS